METLELARPTVTAGFISAENVQFKGYSLPEQLNQWYSEIKLQDRKTNWKLRHRGV